ncbi:hypothetical protein ACW582_16005 [Pseudomonas chlororaphis]
MGKLTYSLCICLAILIAAVFCMDFHLALSASKLYQVYDSVPDEALFYYQSHLMAENLSKHDFDAVLGSSVAYGYGFPFWALTAVLDLSIPQPAIIDIAPHKAFFLSLKWIAFALCATAIYRAKKLPGLILFSGLFFSSSALFFYGKIFSPEFQTLAITGAIIYLIHSDNWRVGIRAQAALFLTIVAICIKLTAAPLLILFGLYYFIALRDRSEKLKKTTFLLITAIMAVALSLLPLFTASGMHNFRVWSKLNTDRQFSFSNMLSWIGQQSTTWDLIPLSGAIGYIGVLAGIILGLYFLTTSKRKHSKSFLLGAAYLFSGTLGFIIAISASGYLDWYLWIPSILAIVGCSSLIPDELTTSKALLIAFLIVIASTPETFRRIQERVDVINKINQQSIYSEEIRALISSEASNCKAPMVIASDMLASINLYGINNASAVRMRDIISLHALENNQNDTFAPFGILPQSIFNDSKIQNPLLSDVTLIAINFGLAEKTQIQNLGHILISPDMSHAKLGQANFDKIKQIGAFVYYRRSDISCN